MHEEVQIGELVIITKLLDDSSKKSLNLSLVYSFRASCLLSMSKSQYCEIVRFS